VGGWREYIGVGNMDKKLLQAIENGREDMFYNSRPWRKKRKQILDRDNNECQICKEEGKVTVGTDEEPLIIHHMKELKEFPELGLEDNNLISVCRYCHEVKCHPGRFEGQKPKIDIPERW